MHHERHANVVREPCVPCRRELEPPPLTVYKDLGSTGARMKCARLCSRLRLPSNGLETIDCKAEVVELADTPS